MTSTSQQKALGNTSNGRKMHAQVLNKIKICTRKQWSNTPGVGAGTGTGRPWTLARVGCLIPRVISRRRPNRLDARVVGESTFAITREWIG
jgi:hypothetical protein